MDDYNAAILTEAKNEYSVNLVNILTPLIIEGFKSICKEAWGLCVTNDEQEKYLMTFQNFLTRVPKWNQEIIDEETKRIIQKSGCSYLEDLLTCVHITQLKILTSIRVASKQKKVDITIPRLSDFIHKTYIQCARKLYSNVYLFEVDITQLQKQKNLRECELICKECLLNVVRANMPVEQILRAYLDETTEEEVIEEHVTEKAKEDTEEGKEATTADKGEVKNEAEEIAVVVKKASDAGNPAEKTVMEPPVAEITEATKSTADTIKQVTTDMVNTVATPSRGEGNIRLEVDTEKTAVVKPVIRPDKTPDAPHLTFSDKDGVVDYDTRTGAVSPPKTVDAPKTIDRLEAISTMRHQQRAIEEAEEEEDDGGASEEKIKILTDAPSLRLDALDVQVLGEDINLKDKPVLTGVEVLAT